MSIIKHYLQARQQKMNTSALADYAYLNARVSILATYLLSDTHLTDFLTQPIEQQRTGIPTLDTLLENEHVSIHLVEQAWLLELLEDFKVLARSLQGSARAFFTYWFRKYEITNLKTLLRGKLAGLDAPTIAAQLLDVGTLAALPLEQLLRTEDVSELLRRLDNSPYGNVARQARRVFEQDHQSYSLDAAIDRHYLLELNKRAHALDATQRQQLLPLHGIFMDRFNLLWLLRYRFAYQLSAAETYYLLIPTRYRLDRANLLHLVELNNLTEVLAHLPDSLKQLLVDANDVSSVEYRLNAEVRRVAEYTLHRHSFSLAKVIAYIVLRELEMHRMLAIIKGKRLGLKPANILIAAELQ
ncbi:MAG: hypothetical protein BWK79_05605 [Beggiatoa sp. IS2]|nr:MAG: hypothetical protein BWK79_05605 [Beggiatoa sp. IS2]